MSNGGDDTAVVGYVVVTDGPVGVGDEFQVAAVTVADGDGEPDQCGLPPDAHAGAAASSWDCEAYGPAAREIGARCFFSPALGGRVCANEGECADRMNGKRQQVFRRINELAASGDVAGLVLEEEFASPDELLGGPGGRVAE